MTNRREVTIQAAEVTVRMVHVADKPMTISVYEQLPRPQPWEWDADEDWIYIGWVNRCPARCSQRRGAHVHVLAVLDGEPYLLPFNDPADTRASLDQVYIAR